MSAAKKPAYTPALRTALMQAPIPPYGFMDEMSKKQQLDWLCSYLDWYHDVHGPALAEAGHGD